ncbi:MAG: hypothetical protein HYV67_00770 [Candidatus Taylorbacteria bacterium]|nr:hypothetical protein [Candidatus Taylorbacteria bacterium]
MKSAQSNVKAPRHEYVRLKKLDKQFGAFLSYAAHLLDIEKAREDVREGRLISQTALFRRLKV